MGNLDRFMLVVGGAMLVVPNSTVTMVAGPWIAGWLIGMAITDVIKNRRAAAAEANKKEEPTP